MQITKTKINRPPVMLIYGDHKIGKSTRLNHILKRQKKQQTHGTKHNQSFLTGNNYANHENKN